MKNQTVLTPEVAYKIFENRDRRFDGLIFIGVITTGVYCRPICPAPHPKFSNCEFFPSAMLAEQSGFRPCLRCKPERSPNSYLADDISPAVYSAIQMIEYAISKDWTLAELASHLEISERHLRRMFTEELGVTPIQYLQSIRLLRAKQLLGDTNMPITQIAFASGFKSLRRFNETFKDRYNLTPSAIRKRTTNEGEKVEPKVLQLKCGFRTPYDWDHIVSYFNGRSAHGAELVHKGIYYRTVQIDKYKGWISVALSKKDKHLSIQISYSLHPVVSVIITRIKRQFDVHANPLQINKQLGTDPVLRKRIENNPGLRSPGAFNPFELLIRVILGQRISVKAATTLMNRFVSTFGQPFPTPIPKLSRLSPSPEVVAKADPGAIAALGMPLKRAQTIVEVAKVFESGKLDFLTDTNISKIKSELMKIPGIGPWTVEYMLMRGVSWPDAFPSTDLGIQKALKTKNKSEIESIGKKWQPYRSYATHHLWNMLD